MIDVIVPVYAGEEETRRCLASLLAARCETAFEVVVVDDCSPEPSLSAWLDEQAAAQRITLLRHAHNRGFVAAVNSGMAQHPERDVVLLNSDTEVANDWLDRIVACAGSSPDIATITPFSNNATVCSYPYNGWGGEVPGTLGLARLDRLFAETLAGRIADLPTAVGFCMFIRRACLDAVGSFDEAAFGRGYGEENDFSLRAAKAGWRNVLAADVFVYHRGAVSFGDGRFELMRQAEGILLGRHPDYNQRVGAFIAADPLRPLRDAVDLARAGCGAAEAREVLRERFRERAQLGTALRAGPAVGRPAAVAAATPAGKVGTMGRFIGATPDQLQDAAHTCSRPALLHVGHSWGGGIDRWIHDYAAADQDSWNLLLRSRTWRNEAGVQLELVDLAAGDDVLLAWKMEDPIPCTEIRHQQYRHILDEIVANFGVEAIIVSSLIGHALDVLDSGLPTVVVLHDFVPFCPALFAWFGKPCVSCDRAALERCLASNPLNAFWHLDDAGQWLALRDAYAERLAQGWVSVAAPGRIVHERYATLFPILRDKPWHEIPHGLGNLQQPVPANAQSEPDTDLQPRRLRLVLPGRLLPHKGLHLFSAMLSELTRFAEVLLLGCGDYGLPFRGIEHVEVVPNYANEALGDYLRDFAPDCALLLSVLPESFSYTLSEMFALQVPVVATRLGAFEERIEDGSNGLLVEPEPQAVLQRLRDLADDRGPLADVTAVLRTLPVRSAAAMVRDYRELLGLDADAQDRPRPMPGLLAQAVVRAAAARRFLREEVARRQRAADYLATRAQNQEMRADAQEVRADAQERRADAQEARADAQERRADAQEARADAQEQRADAQERRADAQERRADAQQKRATALERELANQRARAERLIAQLATAEAQRDMILSSTSWRMTGPLRAVTGLLRRGNPIADTEAGVSVPASTPTIEVPAATAAEQTIGKAPADMAGAAPGASPQAGIAAIPASVAATTLGEATNEAWVGPAPEAAPDAPPVRPRLTAAETGPETALYGGESVASVPPPAPGRPEHPTAAKVVVPRSEAVPLTVAPTRVEVDPGDVLALARARWLERALGMPVDPCPDHTADQVPEGFSVVLRYAGRAGALQAVGCFEGLEDNPQHAATALAMQLDRVVVPAESIAQRFRSLWPEAHATISLVPFPAATAWPSSADRESQRTSHRETLGLPDRTRLVMGIGRVGSHSGLARFAALATQTCERRNDVRFVWLGARNPDWERAHWMGVGLPVAQRRLFLIEDADFSDWLIAADAYVGCRTGYIHDAGVIEALAAGLPVCVASRASLPEALRVTACLDLVDEAEGEAVIGWLSERLANPAPGERNDGGDRAGHVIECGGNPDLIAGFIAACTDSADPA